MFEILFKNSLLYDIFCSSTRQSASNQLKQIAIILKIQFKYVMFDIVGHFWRRYRGAVMTPYKSLSVLCGTTKGSASMQTIALTTQSK